jgi:phage FluMu protein Com
MGNAWSAMERRAQNLSSKVSDVWNDKVENDLDEVDAPPHVYDEQRQKVDALQEHIEVETEKMRIAIYATAARKLWERVLAEAPKQLNCTQCGGTIEAPKVVAAVNVNCPFCSAVNTYEPGMRARMIEHFCAHPLTEEACWEQWLAMRNADNALKDARDPTLAHFQAYERAQIEYWRKYYQVRAGMLPHYAANQEADVQGRMQHYYNVIHNERAWAEAGRPRML